MVPQNVPLWHMDYFEKQQAQESSENRVEVALLRRKLTFIKKISICNDVFLFVPRKEG